MLAVAWLDIPPAVATQKSSRVPEAFRPEQELDVIQLMREEGASMTDAIRRIIEE